MRAITFLISIFFSFALFSQPSFDVRGLCMGAPSKQDVPDFVKLIDEKLAPAGVNTLVLRIDFGYEFKSRPELRVDNPLSEADVKSIVNMCKKHKIKLLRGMAGN